MKHIVKALAANNDQYQICFEQETLAMESFAQTFADKFKQLLSAVRPKPIKVATSMCLSHHPPNPPDESEVLERARRQIG